MAITPVASITVYVVNCEKFGMNDVTSRTVASPTISSNNFKT
jgi:hypothetical protein